MIEAVKYLVGFPGPSGFGSKSTAEEVTAEAPTYLRSLTAIVTGASSGIGLETARVLALRGVRLVLPVRSPKSAREILSILPTNAAVVLTLDLSSISSVRSFVSTFLSLRLPLNLLINNAGRFCHDHALTEDGVETTFATNYLGHFLLTSLLVDKMAETARETGVEGRIVNVSSNLHTWFSGDIVQSLHSITSNKLPYDATQAYALSKLANVLHAKELAERLKSREANVTVNCVHPGVARTRLTRDREGPLTDIAFFVSSKLLKTIPQAAATTCYVAVHPRVSGVSGKYFVDCNEASASKLGCNAQEASRLWLLSESMVGQNSGLVPPASTANRCRNFAPLSEAMDLAAAVADESAATDISLRVI